MLANKFDAPEDTSILPRPRLIDRMAGVKQMVSFLQFLDDLLQTVTS